MKKITAILSVLILLWGVSSADASDDRFQRKRVAVVPVEEEPGLTAVLNRVLSKDKRFEFFDERVIPDIMKEWERRQLGLTEVDDTRELYIMNVDYLVTISDPVFDSEFEDKVWKTNLKARLSVTFVQEGGRTVSRPIRSNASASDRDRSQRQAIEALTSSIEIAAKRIFPIESLLYEADYTSVKLLRGSDKGVKRGQRYIIREQKEVKAGDKIITRSRDAAFVKINEVDREDSSAYIIMGDSFNINDVIAVEKHYHNFAIEFYGGLINYRMYNDSGIHDFGDFDFLYGFKFFYGDRFQIGWGLHTDWPGPGRFNRFSFTDLTLRYNQHLIRRLYLFAEGGGSIDFAFTKEKIRSKEEISGFDSVPDDDELYKYDEKEFLYSWTISGNLGLGFRFITGYNTYIYCAAHYVFAGNFSSWKLWELDEDDSDMERLYKASIKKYDDYVERFSPAGLKFTAGFGFYF